MRALLNAQTDAGKSDAPPFLTAPRRTVAEYTGPVFVLTHPPPDMAPVAQAAVAGAARIHLTDAGVDIDLVAHRGRQPAGLRLQAAAPTTMEPVDTVDAATSCTASTGNLLPRTKPEGAPDPGRFRPSAPRSRSGDSLSV